MSVGLPTNTASLKMRSTQMHTRMWKKYRRNERNGSRYQWNQERWTSSQ